MHNGKPVKIEKKRISPFGYETINSSVSDPQKPQKIS